MKRRVRKRLDLSPENVEWFESTYPDGSFSWVVDCLLTKFREAHTLTPTDLAAIGARELEKEVRK